MKFASHLECLTRGRELELEAISHIIVGELRSTWVHTGNGYPIQENEIQQEIITGDLYSENP